MDFVRKDGSNLIISNLFNEEHAAELIQQVSTTFNGIVFNNVGVKIMRLVLSYFQQLDFTSVEINYNWNTIMTTPQLVCYDKNQWKTLQQLNNWNKEWTELFAGCYAITQIKLNITCSWMDDQFTRLFLEGILKLPNIHILAAQFASKNDKVANMLQAFEKANLFPQYHYEFSQM